MRHHCRHTVFHAVIIMPPHPSCNSDASDYIFDDVFNDSSLDPGGGGGDSSNPVIDRSAGDAEAVTSSMEQGGGEKGMPD